MRKLLAALCLLSAATAARADSITFSTPDISLYESNEVQTGYFDILISNSADSNTSGGAGDYTTDGQNFQGGNGPGGSASGVTNTNGSDLVTGFTAEVETSVR